VRLRAAVEILDHARTGVELLELEQRMSALEATLGLDARLGVVPTSVVYRREAGGLLPMLVCGRA
jgi:hypothetical protein